MVRQFMGEIMDIETLGKYLGISQRTIYRLMDKESLPASKVGRQWRFEKKLIDAWMKYKRR